MRSCPIQQRHIQRDPASRQLLPNQLRNFSRSSRHFQQREVFRARKLEPARSTIFCVVATPPNQRFTRPRSRSVACDIRVRAGVRIENLRCVDSLHGKQITHPLIRFHCRPRRAAVGFHVVRVPAEIAFEPVFNMRGRLEPVVLAGIDH